MSSEEVEKKVEENSFSELKFGLYLEGKKPLLPGWTGSDVKKFEVPKYYQKEKTAENWEKGKLNLGTRLDNLVCFDVDEPYRAQEIGEELIESIQNCEPKPLVVEYLGRDVEECLRFESRCHIYFRKAEKYNNALKTCVISEKIEGRKNTIIELRTGNTHQCVVPNSLHQGAEKRYRFVGDPNAPLPVFTCEMHKIFLQMKKISQGKKISEGGNKDTIINSNIKEEKIQEKDIKTFSDAVCKSVDWLGFWECESGVTYQKNEVIKGAKAYRCFTPGEHKNSSGSVLIYEKTGFKFDHSTGACVSPVEYLKERFRFSGFAALNYIAKKYTNIEPLEEKSFKNNRKKENNEIEEKRNNEIEVNWLRAKGNSWVVSQQECAMSFKENFNGNLIFSSTSFWYFWGGEIWERKEEIDVKKMLSDYMKSVQTDFAGAQTSAQLNSILKLAEIDSLVNCKFDENKNLLTLNDCVLDINTKKTKKHSRGDYLTVLHDFSLKKEKSGSEYLGECVGGAPEFSKFLGWLDFKEETFLRLQEWFGYCLTAETRVEKCLYLTGEGANGKSVLLDTLRAMLNQNCVSLKPCDMKDFRLVRLLGKTLNICNDLGKSGVSDEFKSIISGEQVEADIKCKSGISFSPIAKHVFASNELPLTRDRSQGFFRRFDVLRFEKVCPACEQDLALKNKIKENELNAIFLWSLEGLYRLQKNNFVMTKSQDFLDSHENFEYESNPVEVFLNEECEIAQSLKIPCKKLRSLYVDWCRDEGYKPLSARGLTIELKRLGVEKDRISVEGRRQYVYLGIISDPSI